MTKRVRTVLPILLLAWGVAGAYPVDVTTKMHGLRIDANQSQLALGTLIDLVNHEPMAVRCDVNFRNGPERRRRRVTVEAAARRTATFTPRREVVRVRVNVECWPAHQDGDPGDAGEVDPDIDQIIED